MPTGTHVPDQERARLVAAFEKAPDRTKFARKVGYPLSSLYRWRRVVGQPTPQQPPARAKEKSPGSNGHDRPAGILTVSTTEPPAHPPGARTGVIRPQPLQLALAVLDNAGDSVSHAEAHQLVRTILTGALRKAGYAT